MTEPSLLLDIYRVLLLLRTCLKSILTYCQSVMVFGNHSLCRIESLSFTLCSTCKQFVSADTTITWRMIPTLYYSLWGIRLTVSCSPMLSMSTLHGSHSTCEPSWSVHSQVPPSASQWQVDFPPILSVKHHYFCRKVKSSIGSIFGVAPRRPGTVRRQNQCQLI